MTTNYVSLENRMGEGAETTIYGECKYGTIETNPDHWAKLIWHMPGPLPDYGAQRFVNGGMDEATGKFFFQCSAMEKITQLKRSCRKAHTIFKLMSRLTADELWTNETKNIMSD